jgi:hypothetical protein
MQTIGDVPCADGLTTLLDLAALMDELTWEHALESGLRKKLTTVDSIEAVLPEMSRARMPGTTLIRRVLALRPPGAPPTGSLLETLMVQLARDISGLPPPVRQFVVYDEHDEFVAQVDLCWPELGLFIELDGQQHLGQPCTTPGGRPPWWRRRDGWSGGSPGTRSPRSRTPPHGA